MLWESAGSFFPRDNSHFTRQVARFTRSWSSGKMLAFQPRGFVRTRGYALNFLQVFWSRRFSLFSALWDFSKFFKCPQRVLLSIFWYFATERMLKNPKGSPFQNFRHYETVQNCHFFVFKNFLMTPFSFFFPKIFNVYKGSTPLFVWYLATEGLLKNPKGSLFSDFSVLWDCH